MKTATTCKTCPMAPDKKKNIQLEEKEKIAEALDDDSTTEQLTPMPMRQLEINKEIEYDQKMFRVVVRLIVFVTVLMLTIITRFWNLADPPHIW